MDKVNFVTLEHDKDIIISFSFDEGAEFGIDGFTIQRNPELEFFLNLRWPILARVLKKKPELANIIKNGGINNDLFSEELAPLLREKEVVQLFEMKNKFKPLDEQAILLFTRYEIKNGSEKVSGGDLV